jgi:GxxExxY protein
MEPQRHRGAEKAERRNARTKLDRRLRTSITDGRDPLSGKVIELAIEVHRELGPGLLEDVYEECLCYELSQAGLAFQRQLPLPVRYKQVRLDCGYKLDVVVEQKLVLELKTVEKLLPIHDAQILTYLKISGIKTGLLMNFCTPLLKDGLKRFVL